MSTNISNEAREAANKCEKIVEKACRGKYVLGESSYDFAPILQAFADQQTAMLTARVAELEHKLKFFEGAY